MALVNTNGNYLKITGIRYAFNEISPADLQNPYLDTSNEFVSVGYDIYESATVRQNGLTVFQNVQRSRIDLVSFNYTLDEQKSLSDNMLTAAYVTMKVLPAFSDWADA